jgi:hypothetical protein
MAISPQEEIELWETRRQRLKAELIAHGATESYAEDESSRLVGEMIQRGMSPGYDVMLRGGFNDEDGPPFTVTAQIVGLPSKAEAQRVSEWLHRTIMENLDKIQGSLDPDSGRSH